MSAVDPPVDPPGAPPRNTPATTVSARFHTLSAYVARVSRATMPAGSARPNGPNGPNGHPARRRLGSVRSESRRSRRSATLFSLRRRETSHWKRARPPAAARGTAARRFARRRGEKRRERREGRRGDVRDVRERPVGNRGDDAHRGPHARDRDPVDDATRHDDPSERARRAAHRRLAPLPRDERQRVPIRRHRFASGGGSFGAGTPQPPGSRRASHRRGFLARDRHRDVVEHTPPRLRREPPDPVRHRRGPRERQRRGDARVSERHRAAEVGGVRRDDANQEHVEHQERAQVPSRASPSAPRVRKSVDA